MDVTDTQSIAVGDQSSISTIPETVAQPLIGADPQTSTTMSSNCEKSDEQLTQNLDEMSICEARERRSFPKRPDYLTIGTPVKLLANHFLLKIGKKMVYHYDIEIERAAKTLKVDPNVVDKDVEEFNVIEKKNRFSRKMATNLNRKIFKEMIDVFSNDNGVFAGINPVYDGQKNMFTSKILNGTKNNASLRLTVKLTDEGRDSTFYVNIKLAESNEGIDLNVLNLYHSNQICDEEILKKSVLFINTLLRHNSSMDLVPIGQSIFNPKIRGQPFCDYLLLSYGYYSSVRNLMVGPTLNIDRSAAAFYNSEIEIQKIIGFIIGGNLSQIPANALSDYRRKIKDELLGLQIEALHIQYGTNYRKYRIVGLTKDSAKDIQFEWIERNEEGVEVRREMVSVEDYFKKKYRINLRYPRFPCLEVGNIKNKVKLPLELCRLIPHQRLRRSMTNKECSYMVQKSGQQTPSERLEMCQKYIIDTYRSGDIGNKNKAFLSEFEINVNQNLLSVDSRIISPPDLNYGNNASLRPNDGEWEMFRKRLKFYKSESLKNWIFINISFTKSLSDDDIKNFCKDLCDQAKEMGMDTEPPVIKVVIKNFVPKNTFTGIKGKLNSMNPKPKMILFVTPDKAHEYSDEIYSEIKLLGDVETTKGLTTQCVNINSIWDKKRDKQRWNRSYLRQLMLKVNPKLGGTNVALLDNLSMPSILNNESLMIVGADVNHPAPADKISPSIAALVGSYDNEFSNYYTTVSMQPKSREEMIKNLDKMAVELLTNYQNKQKSLPKHIIFYRDGVSEGQFQHVIDNEYPLLMKAFSKMDAKYKPKLTFIVVQKRHHTRFMTENTKRNVAPGTVVEKGITHKRDFDFYLCSHAGKLGTSRSAHYYVLADENQFTSDDMCKMTYYLCFIYQRCTKSVSIPAPVYYADLAAYRAKVHAFNLNGSDRYSGGDDTESQINSYQNLIKVTEEQKQKLYFS